MTEKPIIFKGEMVRAIMSGHKTQTRRVVKPQPNFLGLHPDDGCGEFEWKGFTISDGDFAVEYAPVSEGDTLWVRETFWTSGRIRDQSTKIFYDANFDDDDGDDLCLSAVAWKRPSIFMPRWASRLLLRVTDVAVDTINDITNDDAIAEGCTGRDEFIALWDKINKKRGFGFKSNPWVWVYTFEVAKQGRG